jgi:ribosome maturation factor RimP
LKKKIGEIYDGLRERIVSLGYECVGFELVKEGGEKILRAYADREGTLDLDDCEKIARALTEFLDENEDDLPERYYLEVSSPGLERPLFSPDDYRRFAGKEAFISMPGQKKATGVIEGVSEDSSTVTLRTKDGEKREIAFADVKRGNLVFVPEVGEKKTFKKNTKKKK